MLTLGFWIEKEKENITRKCVGFKECVVSKLHKEKDRKSENKNSEGNLKESLGRYGWQASIKV